MMLNSYIDHTNLKPTAGSAEIDRLCQEAIAHQFYAVCIHGSYVDRAFKNLKNSKVRIAAVAGFPLGACSSSSKIAEAVYCVENGADEIDMVLNLGFFKEKSYGKVSDEIASLKKAVGSRILKVILETGYLSEEEIRTACRLASDAGADYVKTSTGFGPGGADKNTVQIMLEEAGTSVKVKASGGIRDADTARALIDMGVSRIGTSSGLKIIGQ